MRVLGLLALLVIGLGFGVMPMPANAEPCPFHTHESVITGGGASGAGTSITPTAADDEPGLVAAFDHPGPIGPHSAPDHAVPEGEFCCHVATAVALAVGPDVGPYHGTVSRAFLSLEQPPWAAPLSDIYRPPAFV
jgi:hypothetical protein